jgi:hypothetical protein
MNKLVERIEGTRSKLDALHKHSLKETPTRTIVVDPVLEALGWDVRDPDEVQLEYPTVDGKSVDYALKINRKPVLLVEAKALDDPLSDVKAITQVVGYAANDGIVWCVLTNGIKWKVYRSVEKCPAPDKLMFEVSLDPHDADGVPVSDVARQLWRISRDEMAKGTLDTVGEQTFTDSKVRKALDTVMRDPPRPLINSVRGAMGNEDLPPQKIKESLLRIWAEKSIGILGSVSSPESASVKSRPRKDDQSASAQKARVTRKKKGSPGRYDEAHHISGKPREVMELYRAVDRICLSLAPGQVEKQFQKMYIGYLFGRKIFCTLTIQQGSLKVWLKLKYGRLENPPTFTRDVSSIGHFGVGNLEVSVTSLSQMEEVADLIRRSFEAPE